MESAISIIIAIASFWLAINLLYHMFKNRFISKGFKLHYGLALVYKKENIVFKSIPALSRLSYVLIFLFVLTLIYFYLTLILNVINRFAGAEGSIRLLIPGVNVKGIQILYFLLSLIVAASIHELAHALVARAHGVKVKSIGFAVLPVLALAFVEVDDESFLKLPGRLKSSILSAGPVSNFFFGLLALILLNLLVDPYGLIVVDTVRGGFAEGIGVKPYDILISINNQPINVSVLRSFMSVEKDANLTLCVLRNSESTCIRAVKPGNVTQLGVYMVSKPKDSLLKTLGLKNSLETLSFINWLYVVNISLSFINALPIFLSDGGRIVYEVFKSRKIATGVNAFSLGLLILSLLSSSIPSA